MGHGGSPCGGGDGSGRTHRRRSSKAPRVTARWRARDDHLQRHHTSGATGPGNAGSGLIVAGVTTGRAGCRSSAGRCRSSTGRAVGRARRPSCKEKIGENSCRRHPSCVPPPRRTRPSPSGPSPAPSPTTRSPGT
ncbi:hypothetical protein STRAU_2235 [Streptomyces aurantiacus JA 4570]|uniref:Uncharacterized protein n=1 Tax=Streptomyces aurantiacus JA 4570 TaxID=1286094 RepID=S4ATD2_9ACTN|nr:hypothetical protein STRAU_2235 [Streptomyces aurantiacus JA 4570]